MADSDNPPSRPKDLDKLFDLAEDTPGWQPEDLAAIWQHQLRSLLSVDLKRLRQAGAPPSEQLDRSDGPTLDTFGDLLSHPAAPLEMLQQAKDFAKRLGGHRHQALPQAIASALYFAAIAAALSRLGQRITTLDDATLTEGMEWGKVQPWLDESTRGLFQEALTHLTPR